MDSVDGAKVLRAPNLKRGKQDERITDRIKLEKVLGVTVANNAALASDPNSENVAYPAGCTVVLFNTHTGQQNHIINSSRRSITSLAYSSCGRYLVTGECGHSPAVRVWDLQSEPQPGGPGLQPQYVQVAEFLSHKYGVNCVAFSPSNKYVVSIGTQHDMIVSVWDWKKNVIVASNKVSTKVKSVAFAENGSYFVTVGNRHVKFWFLEYGRSKFKEAVPLMGRSAILGEQRNNYFCDVACGKAQCGDSTFAITRSGLLCEFNNRRLLDKWVELRTTCANCITVGENYIFVGCAEGIVRCFDPHTLRFITTLPRTHYLGVDVAMGLNITHMSSTTAEAKYPDTVAITYDETSHKLTCIYNDHSLYVWDVHDIKRVGKSHSFLYHSACIWGVEAAPANSPLPSGSFLTCSSDDTIRVWTLDNTNNKASKGMYQKNIYSNELLKIVYVDRELAYIKDLDLSATGNSATDKQDSSYDGRNGVRAIRLSPDGKHLASGDRAGNVRIHETKTMTEVCKVEAHDAEVLCLEYTHADSEHKLLASASRDRLIHVFDVDRDYNFLQTLDDHSSSITAVRFLNAHRNLQMVSCGADKSLIFRSLGEVPGSNTLQFVRDHNATGKTTLYDMEVDTGQKHILTACQDRNVRVYSVSNAKHTKSFKGSTGDDGTLIKVVLDRSGIYVATSCTDKTLSVYDYYTGECMATMCGHSELATGLRFTNDCRRLISASGDGCIFVWRVPHDMVVTMQARLSQQAMRQGKTLDNELFATGDAANNGADFYPAVGGDPNANSVANDYRFNVGSLPQWAQKHIGDDTSPPVSLTMSKGIVAPKGRWAQRAERGGIGVKSVYTDSVIQFPSLQTHDRRALDSDGSKDSSLDSGTETTRSSNAFELSTRRRETSVTITKQTDFIPCPDSYADILESPDIQSGSSHVTMTRGEARRVLTDDSALGSLPRDPDLESTAHDGDIEDYSDQEYRQQPLYYPTHTDSASGSEFKVTAMDADELRKSQRRIKRPNTLSTMSLAPTSISGSQDSDDDDDEASTPSGENTDRNPMSMLSVSSESLDQIVHREKYLQSTFESLSGAEMDTSIGKTSISSQYHTRTNGTSTRNVEVIKATKQGKNDKEAVKKREELAKRIADTRRKLQSVGYSSPLKNSQSIYDLTHIPEKDKWKSPHKSPQGMPYFAEYNVPDHLRSPQHPHEPPYTNPTYSSSFCDTPPPCSSFDPFAPHEQTPSFQYPYRYQAPTNTTTKFTNSFSLPSDLQLCGCYMKELCSTTNQIATGSNTRLADILTDTPVRGFTPQQSQAHHSALAHVSKPKKLHLDMGGGARGAAKKLHKSLPVSPVTEERSFLDFVRGRNVQQQHHHLLQQNVADRKSFSYFIDLNTTEDSFKQVCDDIEKFSQDYSRTYDSLAEKPKAHACSIKQKPKRPNLLHLDAEPEDGNFSSDSLEEFSFNSFNKKQSKPRRCVSNYEIYDGGNSFSAATSALEVPKSQSFYLNQSNRNSQDSILSDENDNFHAKSYCNSLESVLSNESDCKSAPLEILFASHKRTRCLSNSSAADLDDFVGGSLPKNYTNDNLRYCYENQSFEDRTEQISRSQSVGTHLSQRGEPTGGFYLYEEKSLKTSETQTETEFEGATSAHAPKKSQSSYDFQQKLLKFETCIKENRKKGVAFYVDATKNNKKEPKATEKPATTAQTQQPSRLTKGVAMYIPSLESKNQQYKSKFCNVLNNKPDIKVEIFAEGVHKNAQKFALNITNLPFEKKPQHPQQTSSLDRHLFSKSLLVESEKVTHKPPKAQRRHSSKTRKSKTMQDFTASPNKKHGQKKSENHHHHNTSNENYIEISYKEKNAAKDNDSSNGTAAANASTNLLSEIYDSLDKMILSSTKMDHDSLEVNLLNKHDVEEEVKMYDSLEVDHKNKNLWKKGDDVDKLKSKSVESPFGFNAFVSDLDKIQFALENIKILNEIQKKICKINTLVDIVKQNMCRGRVKAISSMYETLLTSSPSYLNNLSKTPNRPVRRFRRRNLSLPNFVERRLNFVPNSDSCSAVAADLDTPVSPNSNLEKSLLAAAAPSSSTAPPTPTQPPQSKDEKTKNNCAKREKKAPEAITPPSPPPIVTCERYERMLQLEANKVHLSPESAESSLRRACSLSDLSMQSPPRPKAKVQVSGKLAKSNSTRQNPRYSQPPVMIRSSSTGVLNQSDSENDMDKKRGQSRLMKPTISSQNKIAGSNKSTSSRRRIQQSYSVMNLSNVGQDDSSSEENNPPPAPVKPAVPPRPRNLEHPVVAPRRHRTAEKEKPKANRYTTAFESPPADLDATLTLEDATLDVSTVQLSTQLCDEIALQLTKAADNVVELYKRLTDADANSGDQLAAGQKTDMVKSLELSIAKTHKILQEVQMAELRKDLGQNNGNEDVNQTDTVKKLNDLVAKGGFVNDQNTVVNMMQQYSDILLNMMQQKIQNSNT